MAKKIKDKRKLVPIVIGVMIGIGLSVLTPIMDVDIDTMIDTIIDTIINNVGLVFSALLLTVWIHEMGHLVMGLLNGYEFIGFGILIWTLFKDEFGNFSIRIMPIKGLLGHCRMIHEERDNPPLFQFLFGGVLFNIITSVVMTGIIIFHKGTPFLYIMLFINLLLVYTNWFSNEQSNLDGARYRAMKHSLKHRQLFYELSRLELWILRGHSLSSYDMSKIDQFDLEPEDFLQVTASAYLSLHDAMNKNYEQAYLRHLGMYYRLESDEKLLINLLESNHLFMLFIGNQPLPERKKKRGRKITALDLIYEYDENGFVEPENFAKFVMHAQNKHQVGFVDDNIKMFHSLFFDEGEDVKSVQ
ncbi:site-2 protease family protein [Erysipelothrix urinaevulpis]|uniref:site-2 protease family protein n=1 Tax=Erysipelothrix urinaevulpis TaxID=2683717 RepID=UPI00135C49DC|nr:site-2 protease family protein [Erysipelothrix urinaevulpis]